MDVWALWSPAARDLGHVEGGRRQGLRPASEDAKMTRFRTRGPPGRCTWHLGEVSSARQALGESEISRRGSAGGPTRDDRMCN